MKRTISHQNIFFIGDAHMDHFKMIELDHRPFSSLDEMQDTIISNIHTTVPKDALLILNGDFAFNKKKAREFIKRIDRKIIHIKGNHDNFDLSDLPNVELSCDLLDLKIKDPDVDHGWQKITVCHYPMISWNCSYHGSWLVHAHTHGSLQKDPKWDFFYDTLNVFEVSANVIGYTPRSYKQMKEYQLIKHKHMLKHKKELPC